MDKTLKLGLCQGRHNIEGVEGYIFNNTIEDVTDVQGLEDLVHQKLKNMIDVEIHLYVTGLTVATVAVINYCNYNKIPLVLYHYNTNNGQYYPQRIIQDHAWYKDVEIY